MSGKPAPPAAAAAPPPPLPPPPPPRLLLYVGDGGAPPDSQPRPALHRPPDPDQPPPHLYYKDNLYNPDGQPRDLYPAQAFVKVDGKGEHPILKRENGHHIEYPNIESFQTRLHGDNGEIYQRCLPDCVPSMQPVVIRPSQYSDSLRNGESNCGERELIGDKNYVNYQFLEQSVTHQSIVNQSISILNQQVGVSAVDGGAVAVRTPVQLPQETDRTLQSDLLVITVPLGWRRIIAGSSVCYISPSGAQLNTLRQLREYLQTTGTCKCGLSCPFRPETAFNFDPKVVSKPYLPPTGAELTKLCNHKRKLLANISARAQESPKTTSPSPLPLKTQPQENITASADLLKKKMKKRPGFPNMTQPQMVQNNRHPNDFKVQEMDPCRTTSPGVARAKNQPYPNVSGVQQDPDKTESQVRSSHYLTVNSGWILQEMAERNNQANLNASLNMGLPVIGTNGQIIGVNTSYKHNYKGVPIQVQEEKEEKKEPQKEKEEESQMFCSLNQITPEVMQKINEQQQLFIQQNQKQIEMAMKGYRSQMENQKSVQGYAPQVVIQNGAIMKTNPAKTPPWQVKRNDSMTSPSPKSHKSDNMDFEETNANLSEESNASNTSFQSNDMNAMCSRVPPLPQHYNMMGQQWPPADNKKKPKNPKGGKKKAEKVNFGGNGMRMDQKGKCDDIQTNNIPSFMDDPTGYLAQQTALLNNTISRQVGINSYENQFEGNCYNQDKKKCEVQNVYRSNMVPNASPSPNNTPDSSEKSIDCCKGCNINVKGSENYTENQIRRTYSKNMYKMESSPKYEDSPVTSSTYIERPVINEICGPIQAGTVSTSNVSPTETLLPPEPSPTPSNSSRNTDTPHSHNGSNSSQNYPFNRDNFSNPPTPVSYYSSPQSVSGNQMMHFISNHNVNKNLMEVDNISMVGVRGLKQDYRKKENNMPGYCPPPHLGGGPAHSLIQASYVQTFVTTMASGFSVTRDTITSVLAGKANTVTTSINSSQANFIRPPPPPSVNLATTYAIPNNQPDPFIHSVNLPTSYPLHIAGTTAQNMISKSPLEMVQNVIGSIPNRSETSNPTTTSVQITRRSSSATPGQILISSTGQIIVSNSPMPPPPPKTSTSVSISSIVTNVTTSVTQVIPAVAPGVVNQSTVVVNTLPAPFVLQPPIMAVDGQVVQQNSVMPQIVGGIVNERPIEVKNSQGCVQMLSPESLKKKSKKKKSQGVTNVLQITAPQQNIMVHQSHQNNTSPQFSPRGFQLSPNNNISPPMLQALTIVPGKSGTPAHIVMNGQGNTNNFGSQQILTNTSPSQQINLLQPVNLINNASMPNFPAFQQFIVPNLGGMVMTADGTAIIQENSAGVPMQLQLQTVNGQNVLTPVQNPGVFTGTNGGVVIRAQNQQGKIIQSQHSPGAQFLSPNNQVMMNSPNFNGQLSPLLANLSPTNVTFNTSPHQVRSNNVQAQEFLQTNQMGQTLMVPLSPKQVSIAASNNRTNSTFVQQNTTIVQQQTTLVSNSHNNHVTSIPNIQHGNGNASRLSIDPNVLLNTTKQITKARSFIEMEQPETKDAKFVEPKLENDYSKFINDFNPLVNQIYGSHVRHSVSTQTLVNQQRGKSPNSQAISPPDTTTHSPLGALENTSSPRMYGARSMSTQGNYADTTTKSPEPADANSSAMVQCVSSSEQDMAEPPPAGSVEAADAAAWLPAEYSADNDTQNLMSNIQLMRQTRHTHNVESTEIQYNHNVQNMQQNMMPNTYYERAQYKRKNEFEPPSYRDKVMRGQYNNMVHGQKEDFVQETPKRYFPGTSEPKFERHLGTGNDNHTDDNESPEETPNEGEKTPHKFQVGDLIWGPVKGYASWPGKLVSRADDGKWNVKWFGGDKAPGQVEDGKLLTLSEGLEAHHAARTKHRKSRKLNTHLENAIQEAMAELDKKSDVTEPLPQDENPEEALTDTPKRKKDKKKEKKKTGNLIKIAPKTGETRLRSAR